MKHPGVRRRTTVLRRNRTTACGQNNRPFCTRVPTIRARFLTTLVGCAVGADGRYWLIDDGERAGRPIATVFHAFVWVHVQWKCDCANWWSPTRAWAVFHTLLFWHSFDLASRGPSWVKTPGERCADGRRCTAHASPVVGAQWAPSLWSVLVGRPPFPSFFAAFFESVD